MATISDTEAADLALARRLVTARLAGTGARVWLFGSRARGDAGRWSDIDIAVEPGAGPLPVGLLAELRDELEQSNLLLNVDVVELDDADDRLRDAVRCEGVPWTA